MSSVQSNESKPDVALRSQKETSTIITTGAIRKTISHSVPGRAHARVAQPERRGPVEAAAAPASAGSPEISSASAISSRAVSMALEGLFSVAHSSRSCASAASQVTVTSLPSAFASSA